jgi:hypothetical protein
VNLDPRPLLDAARNGRPWHLTRDCPACDHTNRTTQPVLCVSSTEIARTLNVDVRQITRWRAGHSTVTEPDRHADQLRMAAYEIWPELADRAVAAVTHTCANPECGAVFVPCRSDQRYCTRTCKDASPVYRAHRAAKAAENRRVRQVEDPAWYQRRLAANRAYKADLRARTNQAA